MEKLQQQEKIRKKNKHEGHRARLRMLVERVGLENLNDNQALEFILCLIIPRKDTNVIAHDLLDKFGSFCDIFQATAEEIAEVENMGIRTAQKLKCMEKLFCYYHFSRSKPKIKFANFDELHKYLANLYKNHKTETCYILALSYDGVLLNQKIFPIGKNHQITIFKNEIVLFANLNNSNKILVAHNHIDISHKPTSSDIQATEQIKFWLNENNIDLVDHLIIGENICYSISHDAEYT